MTVRENLTGSPSEGKNKSDTKTGQILLSDTKDRQNLHSTDLLGTK